ncbi:MAG: transcription antitermination factor NusB, partial [Caldimonas sp.]
MSTGEGAATSDRRPRQGARRAAPKSARRKAREFALQGLYEWLLGGADAGVVDAHVREQDGFDKCDVAYFDLLLHGAIREAAAIDAV